MKSKLGLALTAAPHIHSKQHIRQIMLDVIIALLPCAVAGIWLMGARVLLMFALSISLCLLCEFAATRLFHRPGSVGDCSAIVTGMLLVFCFGPNTPLWQIALGVPIAILLVKQLFGGLGNNFLNPALTACMITVNIKKLFFASAPVVQSAADTLSAATPLAQMKAGALPSQSLLEMLLHKSGGSIGEVSSILLIVGGIYLVARDVIKPYIPLAYLGTVALLAFLFPTLDPRGLYMLYQLLGGGLLIGAIFFATDYASSPVTPRGQWLYGIGCGLLTFLLRRFRESPEGITYAILIMNLAARWLDRIAAPRRYGIKRR